MIEKISLGVANQSGAFVPVAESALKLQARLDVLIADTFSLIVRAQNEMPDDAARTAEKFNLAKHLNAYLEDMKNGR